MLKWLRSQDPPCPWNEETCANAVNSEHLHILKWLRSQNPPCPWNYEQCLKIAVSSSNEDMINWIESQSD